MSQALLDYVLAGEHHAFRRDAADALGIDNLAEYYRAAGLTPEERMADRFERLCRAETPRILPDEKICYVRTIKKLPDCFTPDEWEEIRESAVNVIPVLLPYGGAAIAAGNSRALAEMLPADNLAMIGEFVKTDKAKGDLEYYAASAKQAVYRLFGKKAEQPLSKRPLLVGLRVGRRVK